MKITEKKIKEERVAYIPHMGSYDKIPELIAEVGQWLNDKGFKMTGLIYGTYFNSPDNVSEDKLQYEIGFGFEGKITTMQEGKIGIKEIPEHTVLAAMHKGPYTEVGPVIHAVIDYALKNNYDIVGPISEAYLNNPLETPEEELLTEVRIPVIKIK
ncbi:MAG: GyrI-like domain-containing protein [Methanobacterium sp.]|nr:GyrI-like domain-containing protein [Methanobacterium sp.]